MWNTYQCILTEVIKYEAPLISSISHLNIFHFWGTNKLEIISPSPPHWLPPTFHWAFDLNIRCLPPIISHSPLSHNCWHMFPRPLTSCLPITYADIPDLKSWSWWFFMLLQNELRNWTCHVTWYDTRSLIAIMNYDIMWYLGDMLISYVWLSTLT